MYNHCHTGHTGHTGRTAFDSSDLSKVCLHTLHFSNFCLHTLHFSSFACIHCTSQIFAYIHCTSQVLPACIALLKLCLHTHNASQQLTVILLLVKSLSFLALWRAWLTDSISKISFSANPSDAMELQVKRVCPPTCALTAQTSHLQLLCP